MQLQFFLPELILQEYAVEGYGEVGVRSTLASPCTVCAQVSVHASEEDVMRIAFCPTPLHSMPFRWRCASLAIAPWVVTTGDLGHAWMIVSNGYEDFDIQRLRPNQYHFRLVPCSL